MKNPVTFALVVTLAPAAAGQDFNIDVGSFLAPPSSSYGAAPGQAGVWNHVDGNGPFARVKHRLVRLGQVDCELWRGAVLLGHRGSSGL